MKNILLVLFCLLGLKSMYAQPKPDTSKMVCSVVLPGTVTSQTVFSVKADCKINTFSIDVYSLSGQIMFRTESLDEFEIGKKFKSLPGGQYNYTINYSYFRGGKKNELQSRGQIYVVK